MKDHTVLVTGATGFIGTRLVERLAGEGATVRALVRSLDRTDRLAPLRAAGATIVPGDLTDAASVVRAVDGCDHVVNCAATRSATLRSADEYRLTNEVGVETLLRAAVDAGVRRVVHCSTAVVHELPKRGASGALRDERSPLLTPDRRRPTRNGSKIAGEEIVRRFVADGNVEAVIARVGKAYGPRNDKWIGPCRDLLAGRVRTIGDCRTPHQVIYVDDVVEGLLSCTTRPSAAGQCYILSGEPIPQLREIFSTLAEILGVPFRPRELPVAPFAFAFHAIRRAAKLLDADPHVLHRLGLFLAPQAYSIEKAKRELGFRPRVSLKEGMSRTVAWYREAGWL